MAELSIIYRDYSSFRYIWKGQVLAVDPTISEFSRGAWIERWTPEPCDFMFITHAHFDHFADADAILEETDTLMIASPELCDYVCRTTGLREDRFIHIIDGEKIAFESFSVEAIETEHRGFEALWPEFLQRPGSFLRMVGSQMTAPPTMEMQGFLFSFDDLLIFHCAEGLNDITDGKMLREVGRSYPGHILVCAADMDFTVEVAEAVKILQPREVLLYPPHTAIYRRMRINTEPLENFAAEIRNRNPDTSVTILSPDDRYDLSTESKAIVTPSSSTTSS